MLLWIMKILFLMLIRRALSCLLLPLLLLLLLSLCCLSSHLRFHFFSVLFMLLSRVKQPVILYTSCSRGLHCIIHRLVTHRCCCCCCCSQFTPVQSDSHHDLV